MHAYYLLFCNANFQLMRTNQTIKNIRLDIKKALKYSGLVVISGLEPPTHGFSVRCSTN